MTHTEVASAQPWDVGDAVELNARLLSLAALASDLAGEFALQPLLERILRNAVLLLGCESGSICTIDESRKVYRKEVDLDVGCRSGEVFPLNEGVTGAVVRAAGAVTFERYSAVPAGHMHPGDVRSSRAVVGVPIRLGTTIVGACIVFGRDGDRRFGVEDTRLLELFAIHAAVAIANSRLVGDRSVQPAVPLTAREREVCVLVETGLPDKRIALELGISAKTVEKHVGTILRKTGACNRTELASRAAAASSFGRR
jgi:DNA-binding CsgD family transcriptional regulator